MKSIKRRIITGVFAFVICMIFLLHSVSADTEDAFFEMPLGYQTNSRIKATSADSTLDLNRGDAIQWGGYNTRLYSLADGSTVYCLQPFKNPPAPGVHTVSEIRDSENPLTKAFYYLYGGPGFADSGLTTGDAFVDYSIAHYVVSYIFDGCQDTGTGNVFNMLDYASLSQVLECYKRLEAMPSVPGEACVLLFDTGYDAQTGEKCQMMGVFAYRQEYGDIELYKSSGNTIMTEDNSCYSLAGAQYGIYPKGSSTPAAVITTDANGYGKAEHIAVGTYDIKEIKTPAGYALDTNAGAVTVNAKGIITYRCQDKPQNNPVTLLIGKTDGETGNNKPPSLRSLKDAEFKIRFYKGYYDTETALTGKNPERTWIMKTDAEGYCRMSEAYKKSGDDFYYNTDGKPTLPLGTVMIQEICAPKGYLINTKVFIRQITAHGSGESVNTYQYPVISEAVQKGIIRVRKQDKETGGGPAGAGTLQGAVYEVFNSLGEKADTMTTDVNGRAQSKKLQLGDYTVKECTPSTGYLKDTQIYTVALKPDQSNQEILYADVLSRETPQKGSINLEKRDKDTGKQEPQGSGTLQGAVYEIVNSSGQVADTITVSAEGQAQSKELPLGTYTIREKKAAPGYNLDLETHTVSLISENRTDRVFYKTVQSEEAIIRGGVMIEKRDLETDKNIAQGSAVLEKAEIQIISKNLKPVLVEGKSYGTGEVITKLCLDKDGRAGTKENYLPYGNYLLKESKAPTGYNNTGIISREFSIRKQGETVKLNTSETSIKNEIIRGDVQLVKFGSDQECEDNDIKKPLKNIRFIFTSRTTGEKYTVITDENGYATTKQLGNPRGGLIYDTYVVTEDSPYEDYAVIKPFEVTISEEQKTLYYIIENDVIEAPVSVVKKDSTTGRVIPVKGTAFQILDEQKNVAKMTVSHYPFLSERDTWETDEAGSFMLPQKLKPGRYYLKELKAPKGYLKGESLEFQVKGNYHWEEPLVVEYEDNPVMGNLVICKTDKVTGDKLAGVVFEIFAGEDILTGDGTVRAVKDELVDTITTDENGRAESKRLFLGKYRIKEKRQSPGFALSGKEYKAELKYKNQTTETITETLNIENKPTVIEIYKKEKGSERGLSGVQFAVWNKAMTEGVDSEIAEKTILKTANDGKIRIERLLPGVYCIQEVKGIAGYVMDNQIWEVTIDKDGKMQGKSSIEIIVENAKTEITETEAVSLDSNTHETIARENTVIQDTVRFKNLQVGEKVKIQGILMDKISGKPVLIQDKQVTAETEFMAAQGEQEAVNLFKFDASSLKGREVVVFEKAFIGDVEIAAHENLEEEKQAVRFLSPELRTTAKDKDTGKKKTEPKKETVIVDEVQYKNLIPGQKYRIRGILMERETGQELLIEGKTVTKEMTFLAEAAAGSVELEFAFDSSMLEGRSVVVFERIYIEETELAAHADITDKDQTIVIKEKEKILIAPPKKPEKEKLKKENIKEVKTGDTAQMGKFIIFSAGSLCAIGIMAQSLHKMKKRK